MVFRAPDAAKDVIAIRKKHSKTTLADLYDPLTMPKDLSTAHEALDKAVDAAYMRKVFGSDAERVAFLLLRYRDLNDTLRLAVAAKKAGRKRAPAKKIAAISP